MRCGKQLSSCLDNADIGLLNRAQLGIPIERKPFQIIGQQLGMDEDEVISRLERMKSLKILRYISAIFDASKVGYKTALVAFAVHKEKVTEVAGRINLMPFVSHNYERDSEFNLWFTVTLPQAQDLHLVVASLAHACEVDEWMLLPALRTFKIGVALDASLRFGNIYSRYEEKPMPSRQIDEDDITCIRIMQDEFPLVSKPFEVLANKGGVDEGWLIERTLLLLCEGRLRRIAALVNHRLLGYTANALVVWDVPDEDVDVVGERFASLAWVSHCYQRPRYPKWQFSLYTMIHGRDERNLNELVERMLSVAGEYRWRMLLSKREFKKERVKLFS
ncbi:MAG: Lrp/AsnC family transcriptional regulator [Armatimonadota bacterium]|nr:Lrp/AsnC family transcriptional regulator [Armatimonadota bacterium]MCX7777803.1 Lrp/AsnC family transcriptional regulator [Armatimonadota bacterium]MDW8025917.1 Lrp/AsnC family transcriptional regulator [Armatimonadota bacterium]